MKKVTALSGVVLLVLGLTLGMTVSLTQDANALWECGFECTYSNQCKPDGPNCGDRDQVWRRATCSGGPLNCPGDSYWIAPCCL